MAKEVRGSGAGLAPSLGELGVDENNSDIILIGEDTPGRESVPPAPSDSGVLQDRDILCEFPPGQSPSITVTLKDYRIDCSAEVSATWENYGEN